MEFVDDFVGPGGGVEGLGVEEGEVGVVGEAADDDEEVWVSGVDCVGALGDVFVPVAGVVVDGAQLVAEIHAYDVGVAFGDVGHGGQAGEPVGDVEVFGVVVGGTGVEPAVAVGLAAAPAGFGDVVVEDYLYAGCGEGVDDGFVDVEDGSGGGDGGVVLDDGVVEIGHVGEGGAG